MKTLLRLLSCLVLVVAVSSCQEDPASVEAQKDEWSVSYTLDSAFSRTVRFQLNIPKKINLLSVHWDFGDGTTARLKPGLEVVHTYKRVGDYLVRAASDPTDSAIVSDTTWVRLRSSVTDFRIIYKIDPADNQLVHFSLAFPAGFLADSVYWDFGDGTIRLIPTDSIHSHKYKRADDFKVVLSYDPTDPNSVIDTLLVALTNDAKNFDVRYWLESSDSRLVHFNLSYPKGFFFDSLYWDFGDGTKKWIRADSSLTYQFKGPERYKTIVSSDTSSTPSERDSVEFDFSAKPTLSQLKKFNRVKVTKEMPGWLNGWSGPIEFIPNWVSDSSLSSSFNFSGGRIGVVLAVSSQGTINYAGEYHSDNPSSSTGAHEWCDLSEIFCENITESSIIFYIGMKSGCKRLDKYQFYIDYSHGADVRGDNSTFKGYFEYLRIEFYNK
jgi:hypothetical protein